MGGLALFGFLLSPQISPLLSATPRARWTKGRRWSVELVVVVDRTGARSAGLPVTSVTEELYIFIFLILTHTKQEWYSPER